MFFFIALFITAVAGVPNVEALSNTFKELDSIQDCDPCGFSFSCIVTSSNCCGACVPVSFIWGICVVGNLLFDQADCNTV